jgi:hypothetical protein
MYKESTAGRRSGPSKSPPLGNPIADIGPNPIHRPITSTLIVPGRSCEVSRSPSAHHCYPPSRQPLSAAKAPPSAGAGGSGLVGVLEMRLPESLERRIAGGRSSTWQKQARRHNPSFSFAFGTLTRARRADQALIDARRHLPFRTLAGNKTAPKQGKR